MNYKETFKGFRYFWKGLVAAKREMWVSLQVLLVLTLILSTLLFWVEHAVQPENYASLWDSIIWSFMSYLGNPGKFAPADPISIPGRLLWIIIFMLKIAIFAIPAGLVAKGFQEAFAKEKRQKQIEKYRDNLELAFRNTLDTTFREYTQTHPEDSMMPKGKSGYYLPAYVPLPKLQLRYGMDMKDVFETTVRFPQFRIANLAAMHSDDENPDDRLVVTQQYINTPYGCFIDRGSKITIVSTSSVLETLTGWFAHNLAMVGGFNFISKEIEPNVGDFDSFAAMTNAVMVNGYSYEELIKDKENNAEKLKLYEQKVANRKAFLKDLKRVCTGEDSWVICVFTSIMNHSHTDHFHFSMSKVKGEDPLVLDANIPRYKKFVSDFAATMKEEFGLSAIHSERYPLPKGFPLYKTKKDNPDVQFNAFRLNIGAPVLLDNRKMIFIHKIAKSINETFGGSGMTEYDVKYLSSRHYGMRDYRYPVK